MEYMISTSFDKNNEKGYILSGVSDNILDFIKCQMMDGYELYLNERDDEAILKYNSGSGESKVYFVFPTM